MAVHDAINSGVVKSCHDLSEGGLAVAVAEMAFAGGLGAEIALDGFGKLDEVVVLFSESNTRFVVEVAEEHAQQFVERFRIHSDRPLVRLGTVTDADRVRFRDLDGRLLIDESIDVLKSNWQKRLAGL